MATNNYCDGSHCREPHGEVRMYPLGGGAHLILCAACWHHENSYHYTRGWQPEDWATATIYKEANP